MLIEFSVSNFKSFRTRQTLSMVASPRLGKRENVISPDVEGEKLPKLLKVAAIYGPNASGKSSLLSAIDFVRDVATKALHRPDKLLTASHFRFDADLEDEPSNFEYHFIQKGMRYQYLVSATQNRIVFEELTAFPSGKERLLFKRSLIDSKEVYEFGSTLEGGEQVHEAWRKITSPRSLYLAQAAQNSSEDMMQLKIPFSWFDHSCLVIDQNSLSGWSRASRKVLAAMPDTAADLSSFLGDVDIPIESIYITAKDGSYEESLGEAFQGLEDFNSFDKDTKTTLTHKSALGDADFDFSEESEGTKNLIGFWLPWFTLGLRNNKNDNLTLIIDELDSSLHPKIVANIVKRHIATTLRSQLIFTTHDTHLMNSKILRRDQFWITERDKNAATRLFSVHDFEGREGEDLERRYFAGRYRGLPLTKDV
ncbi:MULTISPECIES: ATP/GTP-binding protein [unclassified Pseudomonas]|uniref:AAA family ATPase n=1 Tax=unclassified Pseudomonas TaxID=196821 RepID=UPI000A1D5E17|nr:MULTISPECIES: ATP-binding protein [unclassified Pseudomonas]